MTGLKSATRGASKAPRIFGFGDAPKDADPQVRPSSHSSRRLHFTNKPRGRVAASRWSGASRGPELTFHGGDRFGAVKL